MCALIAPGIQRLQSLPTQSTDPDVQPVRRASIGTLCVSTPLGKVNVVLGTPKTFGNSLQFPMTTQYFLFLLKQLSYDVQPFFLTDGGPGVPAKPEPVIDRRHWGQIT